MTIAPTSGFREAKFIVSPTAGLGTHTTIQSAITAASSGDVIFIRTGVYTENLTLAAGVDLTAWPGDEADGNVTIIGKATLTVATTINISSIRLQTNSDFFLVVSGSAASIINLNSCDLNCTNNTGMSITSSGGPSVVLSSCTGNLGTTGIAYFACSATGGIIRINQCNLLNNGNSTTANTNSGNMTISVVGSSLGTCFSTSGTTALIQAENSTFDCQSINTTAITISSTSSSQQQMNNCYIASGTASAISIGAGAGSAFNLTNSNINSNNTNAITGSGTLNYAGLVFTGTSSTINTSTLNPLPVSGAGTTGQVWTSNGKGSSPTFGTLGVVGGGTGNISQVAYSLVAGGTTTTGAFQAVSSVASGSVLTSAGTAALPAYTAAKLIIQEVRTSSSTTDSTASNVSVASIPTTSVGKQFITLAITPSSSSNILKISGTFQGGTSGTILTVGLFQDSTANALAAWGAYTPLTTISCVPFNYYMVAGTTSSTTFKLRYGADTGTGYANQTSSGSSYGGVVFTDLVIQELQV
jgi:hypothetical protein